MCLRCSPGLFRHGGGAASCHTSSMAAKPHLALTQNSSPTTLANGWRAAQIAESRGSDSGRPSQRAKFPRRARREIPHRPKAPSADGAIPAAYAARPPSPPPRGWWTAAFLRGTLYRCPLHWGECTSVRVYRLGDFPWTQNRGRRGCGVPGWYTFLISYCCSSSSLSATSTSMTTDSADLGSVTRSSSVISTT